MKSLFFSLLFTFCLALGANAQVHGESPIALPAPKPKRPPIFSYMIPKLEVPGIVHGLIGIPYYLMGNGYFPFWPSWTTATVELGRKKVRSAYIVGFGGRYWRQGNINNPASIYRNANVWGYRAMAGYRMYVVGFPSNGLYWQPMMKFVHQGFRGREESDFNYGRTNDVIFTNRLGYQRGIGRRLTLELAVGAGIGMRTERGIPYWGYSYYFGEGVDEMDFPLVWLDPILRTPGRADWNVVGDVSLGLGWYIDRAKNLHRHFSPNPNMPPI